MLGTQPCPLSYPFPLNPSDAGKPFPQSHPSIPSKISSKPGNSKISTNSFVWNTRIRTHVEKGRSNDALLLYLSMLTESVPPDDFTFPFLLKACSSLKAFQEGKQIHTHVVKNGVQNVFTHNALLYMYACCGFVEIARKMFDGMPQRNLVSWNSMIAGYSKYSKFGSDAILGFRTMLNEGVAPDSFSFTVLIRACALVLAIDEGLQIHSLIIKLSLISDVLVQNGLIDMYVKFGLLDAAFELFNRTPERDLVSWNALIGGLMKLGDVNSAKALFKEMAVKDVVSWNSMIAGYVHNGLYDEALAFFRQIQLEGMQANAVTVVSVLSACSHIGALSLGKWIHLYCEKNGFSSDKFVCSTLVSMYAKCGDIENARQIFEMMVTKDVVAWDVMIEALALHGQGKEALVLFEEMREDGVKPDEITFVGVLNACSHAGLVDKGLMYFKSMSLEFQIEPTLEHFTCVVDLLGRAGRLHEALEAIESMVIVPDSVVWGALLSACRTHKDAYLAEIAAKHILELEPWNAANYVLLSNIYAARRQWEDVANIRSIMKSKGIEKEPGCSLIEIGGSVNEFLAGDSSHPQCNEIFQKLDELTERIKAIGYLPNMDSVLHDMAEEERESSLYCHSEKLAVAFGLISTSPGTPIRIMKNLRICCDCHSAVKHIALIEAREIVVRDRQRFHLFKNGECSCGDYW